MAKEPIKMMEEYVAASLKEERFLATVEIDDSEICDFTAQTIYNQFESVSHFQFKCLCMVATYGEQDMEEYIREYVEELNIKDKYQTWDNIFTEIFYD